MSTSSNSAVPVTMQAALKNLEKTCHQVKSKIETQKIHDAIELLIDSGKKASGSDDLDIIHSVNIAAIVAGELCLSNESILGAMLYGVSGTVNIPGNLIEAKFGQDVSALVRSLCTISGLRMDKISLNAENFIQLMLALSDDIRIILIRLADRLYFMRVLESIPIELQKQIVAETSSLYAPLAHRLGMYKIKTELEELAMRYSFPDVYASIAHKIEETKEQNELFIREFIAPIEKELQSQGLKYEIKARTKSIPSIWNKMKKQNIDFEQVYDFFAIRIISESDSIHEKEECWKIYSIVTNIYQPNPSRMRDWISSPKASGYESLHTTVIGPLKKWVEVQIRSRRMDDEAEKGQAAHWKYKGRQTKNNEIDTWLKNIREALDSYTPGEEEQPEGTRMEVFSDYVYVFTPQGDLRKLHSGATVLDFAFDIHSDVGAHCSGAKVNNLYVPIKHVLKTGDMVEITTSKNQKPSLSWLNIAVSSKALSKIKRLLKEAEFAQSDLGRDMLKRKLTQLKANYSDELVNRLVSFYRAANVLELFQGIANQRYDLMKVKEALAPAIKPEENPPAEKVIARTIKQVGGNKSGQSMLIINENTAITDFKLAKCCHPVFGDQIFGFVTVTEGIKIHRADCSNAPQLHMRFAYRVVQARWGEQDEVSEYLATLLVSGVDQFGLLNAITETITKEIKANIRGVSLDTKNGKFESTIVVNVSGKKQLDMLLARISKLRGVTRVVRMT
jgi:GTP diphosphokinase / guanosine-3',5'-bis(diphosphate) 3'-diphosphatase